MLRLDGRTKNDLAHDTQPTRTQCGREQDRPEVTTAKEGQVTGKRDGQSRVRTVTPVCERR